MNASTGFSLTLYCKEFFKDPLFVSWLNNGNPKMSWHLIGAQPSSWSDVIVLVDPGLGGDGTDSDMPEHIWDQIITLCRENFSGKLGLRGNHIPVRLVNI